MRKCVASAISWFLLVSGIFAARSADPQFYKDHSPQPVTISTLNRLSMAPLGRLANVMLVVRMERHERNWELNVSCDGVNGGIYVSSSKSFKHGEKQSEIYNFGFALSSATYRCEAVLKRKQEDGKTKEFISAVEVTVH